MAELYLVTDRSFEPFSPLFTDEAARSFMTDPEILAIGAVEGNEAAGILLLKITDVMIYITYLYVSAAFRRRGIASDLLCRAKSIAFKSDKPLEAPFYTKDGDDPLLPLFISRPGYHVIPSETAFFRVPIRDLFELKDRIPYKRHQFEIVPFDELSQTEKNLFDLKCRETGTQYFDPHAKDYFFPLCMAAGRGKNMKAVLLSAKHGEELEIRYVTGTSPIALMELFRAVSAASEKLLSEEVTTLGITAVNEISEKLVHYLFPGAEPVGAYYMATVDIY